MKNVKKPLLALAVVAGLAFAGTTAPAAAPSVPTASFAHFLSETYGMSFWDAMRLAMERMYPYRRFICPDLFCSPWDKSF